MARATFLLVPRHRWLRRAGGSGDENAYQLLWEIKRCAYAKMSAARPLPSATTTGTAGFLVTDSRTVRMVLGPPSSTSSTTGTPWVRSVMPTVIERKSARTFSVSISRYVCRDWNYSTHSNSYQHLSPLNEKAHGKLTRRITNLTEWWIVLYG